METATINNQAPYEEQNMGKTLKRSLLLLNSILLGLGNCCAPLMSRLYFLKGGKRVWLSSFLETAGWPFILFPLFVSYLYRRSKEGPGTKIFYIQTRLFLPCVILGILTGLDDYLYAFGVARLPVSTSALLISTQLAFTAGFAFLLVSQKFTSFGINAIFLLTLGGIVLGLHTSGDRPNNESKARYLAGFFMTLGASALYGFVLPAIELTYKKARQTITYTLVMEMQMIISFFATAFCTAGMLANHEFPKIPREAKEFQLGESNYYGVIIGCALLWQCFFMGAVGVISCASSLLSGVLIAALLPVTEILAVLIFHEKFQVEKGIALALSLWGFISYFYGMLEEKKKKNRSSE